VVALGDSGAGVLGTSNTNDGVAGRSTSAFGVFGASTRGVGVRAVSEADRPALEAQAKGKGSGVVALCNDSDGVFGQSGTGVGVHGKGGRLAGFFEGDVEITGDLQLPNADCAEDFDIAPFELVEPGSVMVLGSDEGALYVSQQPYDKRVAGVVSGAGKYKPGIVLDKRNSLDVRRPIALLGKVYCKVDACYGQIEVGDLLTTSATPGHAMKAADPSRAFGAVIGKSLRRFSEGQGLIPILIALQ